MNHIATVKPSAPREDYSLLIMGVSNGVKMAVKSMAMASGGNSPLRQGAGTEFCPPKLGFGVDGGYRTFRGRTLSFP